MESYLDLTRLTLRLGNDGKIDEVLLDEQIQRIDIYISHSGETPYHLCKSKTGKFD